MIIKGERVKSSRRRSPLINHLLRGEENESVVLLAGTEADLHSAFDDARALGRSYSLRHFIIAPAEETSRDEAFQVLAILGHEFSFRPESAILIEHAKARAGAGGFGKHWHALVPEQDLASGSAKTLSSRFAYLRNLKCARIAEARLGHKTNACPHSEAVIHALKKDGHLDIAARLQAAVESHGAERPREGFSRDVQQKAKRLGVDVPAARAAVRASWDSTRTRADFEAALHKAGLRLTAGERKDTSIIETSTGVFVGAAHRLARVPRAEFITRIMEGKYGDPRAHNADECKGVFRASVAADEQTEFAAGRIGPTRHDDHARGGPPVQCSDQDLGSGARVPVKPGSHAPEIGRHRSLRARGRASNFRKMMARHPAAAASLLNEAAAFARSPAARTDLRLDRMRRLREQKLTDLALPPPSTAEIKEHRQRAKRLEGEIEILKTSCDRAAQSVTRLQAEEPGLIGRLDGSRKRWAEKLAGAVTKSEQKQKELAARKWALQVTKDALAQCEEAERTRHRNYLRSAQYAERSEALRAQIQQIGQARKLVAERPFVAWGGVIMALATVNAVTAAFQFLEEELGRGPIAFGQTDIWGIGILG